MNNLDYSTLKEEGPLNVSKWVKIPLLIDEDEMASLMETIREKVGPFSFYNVQGLVGKEEGVSSSEAFLSHYRAYITPLKRGEIPPAETLRGGLSHVLSLSSKCLYAIASGDRRLIKARLPVVQMQANNISYSKEDGEFRTQVFGSGTITWGILLGYPYLFQDPKTFEIVPVHEMPNTSLFKAIQDWVRHNTRPTPFLANGKKKNEPIRLGKACFAWINNHPQLKEHHVTVVH